MRRLMVKPKLKKISLCFVILVFISIAGYLFYYFPLQRIYAEIKFYEYLEAEGIDASTIESIEYHKDIVQDGYFINVKYVDDDNYSYRYRYYLISTFGDKIRFHKIYREVYYSTNTRIR